MLKKEKQPKQPKAKKQKKEGGVFGTLIIALIAAAIVFAVLLNVEKNIMANYEKAMVVVAKEDIPEGMILNTENLSTYLTVVEIEKNKIPAAAYTEISSLINFVTANKIDKGSMITSSLLYENTDLNIEASKNAYISFNVSAISQAVNGVIRSGDKINLYTMQVKDGKETEYYTKDIWNEVFVYAVYDGSGVAIANDDTETPAQLLTVIVPEAKIQDFYNELKADTIRIAKISK